MNQEIREMFDEFSQYYISKYHLLGDINSYLSIGYTIFTRINKKQQLDEERLEKIKIFYYCLEKNRDLKEARKKSGFDFCQSRYYISFLNKEFLRRTNNIFFTIPSGRKRRDKKVFSEHFFVEYLENLNVDHL